MNRGFAALALFLTALIIPGAAQADPTQGTSCTGLAAGPISGSTNGASTVSPAGGNNLVCINGTWQYPAYQLGSTSAACNSTNAGALQYTSGNALEICNGSAWTAIVETQSSPPPTAPAGSGYFVLSGSTYTGGGLGGTLSTANAKCLTDLTTNTGWAGYPTAHNNGWLTASNVFAFLCITTACNSLQASTTYTFANAGDSAAGGAYFTTNSSGLGAPGDSVAWSAANRFAGTYQYWTNMGTTSSTAWSGSPQVTVSGSSICSGGAGPWSNASSSGTGIAGISTSTGSARWNNTSQTCNLSLHLICFVNP